MRGVWGLSLKLRFYPARMGSGVVIGKNGGGVPWYTHVGARYFGLNWSSLKTQVCFLRSFINTLLACCGIPSYFVSKTK